MVGSTLKICAEYSAIAMRNPKISPAFDPFLRHDRSRRDAIVIYRTPEAASSGRNASRNASSAERSQTRRDLIQQQASQQQAIETQIFERYQTRSQDLISGPPLMTRSLAIGTLPVASVEVTRLTLDALAEEPEVIAILPNQAIHLIRPQAVDYQTLFTDEAEQGCTWGLKQLGIPAAWETARGAGVRVAVLDSGVYGDHPALKDRVKKFVVVDPLGRRIETQPSFDSGQHGTHVCGTIAGGKTETGVSIGVAPEAELIVAGVLVGNATMMTLIEGLAWAIENEARIINMSLGLEYYEPLFGKILDVLISQYDILPVVAIGNSNHGNTSSPGNSYNAFSVGALEKLPEPEVANKPSEAAKPTESSPTETPTEAPTETPTETKPAETPKAIATDNLAVTFFSSGASLVFPGMEPEPLVNKPDVVAPGAQVYSCIPPEQRPGGTFAYTYMDGTSMACPHVAGVAALLMSANPDASATDVLKTLKETALHPSGSDRRPDNRWGYGMVQPLAALELIKLA